VKGFFWAALLSPFWLKMIQDDDKRQYVTAGFLLGLFGLGVFALVERFVFPGLLDVTTDYRINALFSTMHTGGGHIESYLALVMPFIAVALLPNKQRGWTMAGGSMVFVLSLYTLLMTYSRGGAIGLAAGLIVLLGALYLHFRQKLKMGTASLVVLPFLVIIVLFVMPVLKGDLMQHRIQIAQQDSQSRHQHWQVAIDMMGNDLTSQIFGMGLGSFPRHFFWSNQQLRLPATYSVSSEGDQRFLMLRGGDSLFIGQYIPLKALAHQNLTLTMDLRSPGGLNVGVSVPICEKSLQYSFRCISAEFQTNARQWSHVEKTLDSQEVGAPSSSIAGGLLTRPVQLAFYAGGDSSKVLEVDNVHLRDAQGQELIVNGDFSDGTDRWYFSTESHNPWHIFNIWIQILFDMGWLGLSSFVTLLLAVYYRLFRALRHDCYAPILLASFSGFLVIGYVDSPFDAPRLSFLFFLLVVFALFGCKTPSLSSRVHY
jgi:O-antigen ligase